jgi:hypothetical protein
MNCQRFILCLIVVGVVSGGVVSCSQETDAEQPSAIEHRELDSFESILDALVWLGSTNAASAKEAFQRSKLAEKKLRKMGPNVLPLLKSEVRRVGAIRATNRQAATAPSAGVEAAFALLGKEAEPLTEELIEKFYSGRSIGAAIVGLTHINSTKAGLALVSALTNADPYIHSGAMSGLSTFTEDEGVSKAVIAPTLQLLNGKSQLSRAVAALSLGSHRPIPEIVLPELLRVAQQDEDFVVTSTAVKSIGRYGTNAIAMVPKLKAIARDDVNYRVRRAAEIALHAISGLEGVLKFERTHVRCYRS